MSLMNKTELVATIAEKAEISKKDAERALNAFTDTVSDALREGDKIQLVGFGAERTGRNPQSGETMVIPASKIPKFKAGKALKDAIN